MRTCRYCKIALVDLAPTQPRWARYDDARTTCTASPTCEHEPEPKPRPRALTEAPDVLRSIDYTAEAVAHIDTGLSPDLGATRLKVWYALGCTVVAPVGEAYNADAWFYDAIVPGANILAWYLDAVRQG